VPTGQQIMLMDPLALGHSKNGRVLNRPGLNAGIGQKAEEGVFGVMGHGRRVLLQGQNNAPTAMVLMLPA
ncbi:MAG: hypothetical protein AAFO79_06405, partial [Pseudomonadota bacterium]